MATDLFMVMLFGFGLVNNCFFRLWEREGMNEMKPINKSGLWYDTYLQVRVLVPLPSKSSLHVFKYERRLPYG